MKLCVWTAKKKGVGGVLVAIMRVATSVIKGRFLFPMGLELTNPVGR